MRSLIRLTSCLRSLTSPGSISVVNSVPSVGSKTGLKLTRPYSATAYTTRYADYDTLSVSAPVDHVLVVELNRPEESNAFDRVMFRELLACFREIHDDKQCRAVVISGFGKQFSIGRDEDDRKEIVVNHPYDKDVARRAKYLRSKIGMFQDAFNTVEKCQKPVISAIHGACVGTGVDLVCTTDIRFCSADAYFQLDEVRHAVASYLGSLQRMPKMVASESLLREIVFSGRRMTADEAKQLGLVSQVFPDEKATMEAAVKIATTISLNSPVGVQGAKVALNFSRDHTVRDGLNFMTYLSMCNLQSEDYQRATSGKDPKFEDL